LHSGTPSPIADAIGRAKSRVGKAVVSRIDRIAAKPPLTAAETADVAAILAAMTDHIAVLTAKVDRQAAPAKPPAAVSIVKPHPSSRLQSPPASRAGAAA
jgi:hypothetical protein